MWWFYLISLCGSIINMITLFIVNFIKRNNLRMRKKQQSKNVSKEDMRAKMLEWHSVLRERLIRSEKQDDYDEKWGKFRPECRLNVDQSPCPFVFDSA